MIDKGYECLSRNEEGRACDVWLEVWDAVKKRAKPEFKNLDYLDKQYQGSFFIRNLCQDLENELHNAGKEDSGYLEKRINYCQEFLECFPGENELIIHNMRRAIADSYSGLNNYEQAEIEFEKLVQDFPDNPWGYIGWGDMYFLDQKKILPELKSFMRKHQL